MKNLIRLAGAFSLFFATSVSALTIQFDYSLDTNLFFKDVNSLERKIMDSAGFYFSNLINDRLDPVDFDASIELPGSGRAIRKNVNSAQDVLTVFVGGVDLDNSTLAMGGPSWFRQSNSRGQIGHTNDPATATDFAPRYGRIGFDTSGTDWFFDSSLQSVTDIPASSTDFFSVAIHELAHVLGIGTAPSWERFVMDNTFTGDASVALFGDAVPLTNNNGHFAQGTNSTINGTGTFGVAMMPRIPFGERRYMTDLDLAALSDVGWEVTAVPAPPALWLFLSGLFSLIVKRNHFFRKLVS